MKLLAYLHRRRDIAMLLAAFLLLLLAAFKPAIQLQRDIYSYFLVADISQSMNTQDATLNGKPISRLIYTQQLMHEVVAALPCGSKVSIGVFAGVNVASLYTPIEVCDNFAVIQDTITHLTGALPGLAIAVSGKAWSRSPRCFAPFPNPHRLSFSRTVKKRPNCTPSTRAI